MEYKINHYQNDGNGGSTSGLLITSGSLYSNMNCKIATQWREQYAINKDFLIKKTPRKIKLKSNLALYSTSSGGSGTNVFKFTFAEDINISSLSPCGLHVSFANNNRSLALSDKAGNILKYSYTSFTDSAPYILEMEYTKNKTFVYFYPQNSSRPTPTIEYSGNLFSGMDLKNTYCGVVTSMYNRDNNSYAAISIYDLKINVTY